MTQLISILQMDFKMKKHTTLSFQKTCETYLPWQTASAVHNCGLRRAQSPYHFCCTRFVADDFYTCHGCGRRAGNTRTYFRANQ